MHARDTGGTDFAPAPAGNSIARCIALVDLGTREDAMYGTRKHQVWVQWELPNELHRYKDENGEETEKPFTVSAFYTLSLSEKANLRHDLESWRGRRFTDEELSGFNMRNVLDKPCMVNIIHQVKNGKTRAEVASVSPVPKGMDVPPRVNPLLFFSYEEFSYAALERVPKGIRVLTEKSEEYAALKGQQPQQPTTQAMDEAIPDFDDDMPF